MVTKESRIEGTRFDFPFGRFFGRVGGVVRDYVMDTFESRLERVVIKPVPFNIVAIGPPE